MNLVDSSAWIEYFRGNESYSFINSLISVNGICTNDIILAEMLPAINYRNEKMLAELLNSVKKYALSIDWQEIREIQLLNYRFGNNGVGISDIIIAQNCIQNKLILITHDKHFAAMAKYIPLDIRQQ